MIRGQERTHEKGDLLNFSEFWLIFSYKTVSKINVWAVGNYVDENTDTLQNTVKLNIIQIIVLISKVKTIKNLKAPYQRLYLKQRLTEILYI